MEQYERNELYCQRRLDRDESDFGICVSWTADRRKDLYAGVYRRRWVGHTLHSGYDRGAWRSDADVHRRSDERSVGRCLATDVEHHQRDGLYGLGRLDRHKSDVRRAEHGCIERQLDVHADVFGCGRVGVAIVDRDIAARTNADVQCDAGERSNGHRFATDVEHDERNGMYRIRRLVRHESDVRHAEQRSVVGQRELYPDVYRRGWIGGANGRSHGAPRADSDVLRIADERSVRRRFAIDMGGDERHELHRFG